MKAILRIQLIHANIQIIMKICRGPWPFKEIIVLLDA